MRRWHVWLRLRLGANGVVVLPYFPANAHLSSTLLPG